MNDLDMLYTRRSVRRFTGKPVSDDQLHRLLLAGMNAPSCTDARDWSFIVIRDKALIQRMAEANGKYAAPLLNGADIGLLVCGDLARAFPPAPDYWIIDCAIATENIHLAAHAMGLGSCWLGLYPQTHRVDAQRQLFGLPEHIVPHSILAIGHPAGDIDPRDPEARWDDALVHFDRW